MTNEHRKPTALDTALDYAEKKSIVDSSFAPRTLAAARRELEIKTELCEATIEYTGPWIPTHGSADRFVKARDAYRTWRAEQEKQS